MYIIYIYTYRVYWEMEKKMDTAKKEAPSKPFNSTHPACHGCIDGTAHFERNTA